MGEGKVISKKRGRKKEKEIHSNKRIKETREKIKKPNRVTNPSRKKKKKQSAREALVRGGLPPLPTSFDEG